MKKNLCNLLLLLISASSICGMCSKSDAVGNSNNNPNQPVLSPDSSWVYFDDCPGLVEFYNTGYSNNTGGFNNRPQFEKWVATKIGYGFSGINTTTQKRYLSWSFENTGDTRFLSNTLNPGGKEVCSVFINDIASPPATGTYTLDIDFKQGFCWYTVYKSSGSLFDSTRTQGITNSTFTISKLDFFQAMGSTADRYKMSGTATFNIMHWENGTSFTSDIHTLQCHFNNVLVDFMK
ncbi:MAG TPA: hypothetical protein VFS36_06925 [Chitinophagaceae bacterium]|jgi:hypothetical protein|nr:hypothetical protein [Chitinophagaceae bacterium]